PSCLWFFMHEPVGTESQLLQISHHTMLDQTASSTSGTPKMLRILAPPLAGSAGRLRRSSTRSGPASCTSLVFKQRRDTCLPSTTKSNSYVPSSRPASSHVVNAGQLERNSKSSSQSRRQSIESSTRWPSRRSRPNEGCFLTNGSLALDPSGALPIFSRRLAGRRQKSARCLRRSLAARLSRRSLAAVRQRHAQGAHRLVARRDGRGMKLR